MHLARPTVLLVHSDAWPWRGLRAALADCHTIRVIGHVQQAAVALRIVEKEQPALIIMSGPVSDAPLVPLVHEFQAVSPVSTCLIVGGGRTLDYAALADLATLQRVAYVLWEDLTEETLPLCLHLLLRTHLMVMSPAVVRPVAEDVTSCLSEREREVFRLAGSGMTYERIATRLYIGTSTVKTHAARIRRKLKLAPHEDVGAAYRRLTRVSSFG